MASTEAHIRATRKWEAENYDKFNVRMPKGTKERIEATGKSINAFCREAIQEKLEKEGF